VHSNKVKADPDYFFLAAESGDQGQTLLIPEGRFSITTDLSIKGAVNFFPTRGTVPTSRSKLTTRQSLPGSSPVLKPVSPAALGPSSE
jgi:hypothetical protein